MKSVNLNYKSCYQPTFDVLKYFGTWSQNVDQQHKKLYYTYCFVINVIFLCMFNVGQFVNILNQSDFKQIILCSFVFPFCCMPLVKSYFLFKNRIALQQIQRYLHCSYLQPSTEEYMSCVKQTLEFYLTVKKCTERSVAAILLAITLIPFIYGNYSEQLPLEMWCPFDHTRFPLREIVYGYQILSMICVSGIYIYVELICLGLFSFVGLQCDLFCNYLSRVKRLDETLLNKLVKRYENLRRIFGLIQKVFSEILMFQLMGTGLGLCLTIFVISMAENFLELFSQFGIIAVVFILQLLPCWFSTNTKTKSEKIPTAVYSLPWYDCDSIKLKKDIVRFIHMTQKPIEFSAMGFVPISTNTFIKIMRSTFSFSTFLDFLRDKETNNPK